MAGVGTQFTGPLSSGTVWEASQGAVNTGLAVLQQSVTLTQNGATAVSGTITVPYGSVLVDILADTTVAWNSGTSDTLSVGTAAAGTQYVSGESVAAVGRLRPTYTAAQLSAMEGVAANTSVVATVTPVGTTATTGTTTVTLLYVQTAQPTIGEA